MGKEKIVVTAPTSAVAGNFIKHIEKKYEIITVGRHASDIKYDFSSGDELFLPEGISSIIHFAGILHAETDEEILEMSSVNVGGALKLCMAARNSGIKHIVNISSISATLPQESMYYGYYSMTKKQGEETAMLYCRGNGLTLCTIRPSQIFGTDKAYAKAQPLLYLMFNNAKQGNDICIYGRHDAIRNYIFADNLFNLIDAVIERHAGGTIDAIDSKNYRLSETADMIVKAFGGDSKVRFLDDKPDIEDNGFYLGKDCFKEYGIPFIEFNDAIRIVAEGLC